MENYRKMTVERLTRQLDEKMDELKENYGYMMEYIDDIDMTIESLSNIVEDLRFYQGE